MRFVILMQEIKWGAAFAAPRGQRGGLNEVDVIITNYKYLCCVPYHKKNI